MVSGGKLNILGALQRSKIRSFQQFSKTLRNPPKSDRKFSIFKQNQFST